MSPSTQGESSCLSCRARKVKCDRVSPQCSPCKKRKLNCEIPVAPPRVRWLRPRLNEVSEDDVEDLHARRRPLFTAHDLAHNAAELVFITRDISVVSILDELDQQTDGIGNDQTLCNGPFHVFQATEMLSTTQLDSLSDIFDPELWNPRLANVAGMMEEENEYSPDQLAKTPEFLSLEDPLESEAFILENIDFVCPTPGATQSVISLPSSPSRSSASDLEDFTMPLTKMLLDHYRHTMVTFFTPARVEAKSPWEAIYIPSLLSTVGEIGLAGDSSNAKVSLLFAVFAISAFSQSQSSSPAEQGYQDWNALGELYRERASRRLKQSLFNLSHDKAKKEKYKDILMALLSMVTICVVSGKMENAAHYLRDIEEIINLHGVHKVSQSSKVRMLHSIYLYLRVVTERTCIESRSQPNIFENSLTLSTSSSQDISTWDSLIGFSSPFTEETLNLDTPFKSTFEEIYSVPQSLFKLILQTTHLSVLINKMQTSGTYNIDHGPLSGQVKDLESRICTWEYECPGNWHSAHIPLPQREIFPYHFVQAMYKALIVYFYRSVRDVNATILQFYVKQIIDHLFEYDKKKEKHMDQSANTCWPGFIAGCEALDPKLREQISDWLERSGRSTGIRMFIVALEALQKVWQTRSLPGMQNAPWNRVLEGFSELRVLVLS
ncbi:Fungal transcriptional regulatory protein, N-terminal [Penicillium camemberti]|uniref:Fungal transcriptional regulatory protein, N-terminal n=1 Tax=Penicillium camemberti (strain FM 013) TaxID=1429867 RepID=A0A0G4PSL5_PENC3|nr:Fungal transcriptional regulatory protein, N-terminal [Penicillium camemberti]